MSRSQPARQHRIDAGKRKLLFVSRLRIVDAWVASAIAIGLVAGANSNTNVLLISLAVALVFALADDARIRAHANGMLGANPSNSAPPVFLRAIADAARPIGISPRDLFPRHLSDRARAFGSAFAAAAVVTRRGTILLIGDALAERSRDAANPNRTQGERKFAYDEVRAVLGHELAHVVPGTGASSRLLAVPHRFSTAVTWTAFWAFAIDKRPLAGLVAAIVAGTFHVVGGRNRRMNAPMRALEWILAIASTVIVGLPLVLLLAYLVWPLVRPLSAMAIQRRIENACDRVAVAAGAARRQWHGFSRNSNRNNSDISARHYGKDLTVRTPLCTGESSISIT